MEYLTIKEYADRKSITPQAVYKQIRQGRLEAFTRNVDGREKTYIALDEPTATQQPDPAADAPEADITALERAIEALTAQLAEKDRQIARLTDLLDHAQQLQGHAQKLLEAPKVDQPEQAAPMPETAPLKRRSFWDWLAGI